MVKSSNNQFAYCIGDVNLRSQRYRFNNLLLDPWSSRPTSQLFEKNIMRSTEFGAHGYYVLKFDHFIYISKSTFPRVSPSGNINVYNVFQSMFPSKSFNNNIIIENSYINSVSFEKVHEMHRPDFKNNQLDLLNQSLSKMVKNAHWKGLLLNKFKSAYWMEFFFQTHSLRIQCSLDHTSRAPFTLKHLADHLKYYDQRS